MVWLTDILAALAGLTLDAGLWLVVGFLAAGVIHAWVPEGWLERQLGGRSRSRLLPILKASAVGLPLPLCSCSVIPVASSLRARGASRGATAAFAISTPQTGEESIPLTWALFGPVFAIARPIIALVTAFTAGAIIDLTDRRRDEPAVEPPATPGGCCCHGPSSCGSTRRPLADRVRAALRYAFVTLPDDLAPWLVGGLVIAAVIAASVPEGWMAAHLGGGILPMLLVVLVGIPLYICATSSTPLAFTLVAAGMSPGAALVLLLAGPATNAATMAWSIRTLGLRATAISLGVIVTLSIGCGLAFDALFAGPVVRTVEASAASGGGMLPSWLLLAGAVGLAAMMAASLIGAATRGVAWLRARRSPGRSSGPAGAGCCAHHDHAPVSD